MLAAGAPLVAGDTVVAAGSLLLAAGAPLVAGDAVVAAAPCRSGAVAAAVAAEAQPRLQLSLATPPVVEPAAACVWTSGLV